MKEGKGKGLHVSVDVTKEDLQNIFWSLDILANRLRNLGHEFTSKLYKAKDNYETLVLDIKFNGYVEDSLYREVESRLKEMDHKLHIKKL